MKKTKEELKKVLAVFSSKEAQIVFLTSIYIPGYQVVLELLEEEYQVVDMKFFEQETRYAIQNNDELTIRNYGIRFVKYYLEHKLYGSLWKMSVVIKNKIIADYLLEHVPSEFTGTYNADEALILYYSIGIAGEKKQALDLANEKAQLASEFAHVAVGFLEKQKRYLEAIEQYIKRAEHEPLYYSEAWWLAVKYVPEQKKRIAGLVVNAGVFIKNPREVAFVEAAREIGKLDKAIQDLKKLVKQKLLLDDTWPPRFYRDIIRALQEVGLNEEVGKMLEKAKKHFRTELHDYDKERAFKEMTELYQIIGDMSQFRFWYQKCIDHNINKNHTTQALQSVKEFEKVTKDRSLRRLLIPLFERTKWFNHAILFAREFGLEDQAKMYKQILEAIPVDKRVKEAA